MRVKGGRSARAKIGLATAMKQVRDPRAANPAYFPLAFMPVSLGLLFNPKGTWASGAVPEAELRLPSLAGVAPRERGARLRAAVAKVERRIARAEGDCVRDAWRSVPYGTFAGSVLTISLVVLLSMPTRKSRLVGFALAAILSSALFVGFGMVVAGSLREGCRTIDEARRGLVNEERIAAEAEARGAR